MINIECTQKCAFMLKLVLFHNKDAYKKSKFNTSYVLHKTRNVSIILHVFKQSTSFGKSSLTLNRLINIFEDKFTKVKGQ